MSAICLRRGTTGWRGFWGSDRRLDFEGVLQDVHWSFGLIGYFPTYTLGNLYAAQFMSQAQREIPDFSERLRTGDFSGLLGWLRSSIHSRGSRMTAAELVKEVTGEDLQAGYLMEYLERKFSEIYGL